MSSTFPNPPKFLRSLVLATLAFGAVFEANGATTLADAPLYSSIVVPANVTLALSVEFPTADSDAYYYYPTYSTSVTYIGYYNPNMCYQYVANSTYSGAALSFGTLAGYFKPVAPASAHACTGNWSGNFLNWATTQTIDPLRRALTGGARIVDTNTATILQKAYEDNQASTSNQQVKSITKSYSGGQATATALIAGATPFNNWSSIYVNNLNTGLNFVFSQSAISSSTITGTSFAGVTPSNASTAIYVAQGAVQVCSSVDAPYDMEGSSYVATAPDGSNITLNGRCRGYPYSSATATTYQFGGLYKPFGLMQQYSAETSTSTDSIRYAVTSYLLDAVGSSANEQLDAGVLRAKMKSVGPWQANPGSAVVPNAYNEWSASTGQFVQNPNSADANASPSVTGSVPAYSGVSNYLNLFGFVNTGINYSSASAGAAYKRYDSVGELYYTATRYYRNLGNLYYNTGGAGTGSTIATAISNKEATNDNFPVITSWNDPIAYACSANYIIGIGDEHTWNDGDVPGSTLNGGYEENLSVINGNDAAVNATKATNYIANLEHVAGYTGAGTIPGTTANNSWDVIQSTGLGGTFLPSSSTATWYLAGLAFDSHVRDIRTDITIKAAPVTISTYWLDVMEANDYHEKNVYWMAAKYGGFRVNDASFGTGGYPIFEPTAYSATSPATAVATGSSAALATYSTTLANTPLALTAWSSTATSSGKTVPTNLDEYGNVEPDNYYEAGNGARMTAGLNAAFKSITSQVPAGTSTALNFGSSAVNTSVGGVNVNYIASYANDWSGDVAAQSVSATTGSTAGSVTSLSNATTIWDARWWLPPTTVGASGVPSNVIPLSFAGGTGGRIIATSKTHGAGNGVPFETASLSSTERATLGSTSNQQSNVLNYIRGDQCNETAASTALSSGCQTTTGNTTSLGFRARRTSVLGDIVDSKPVVAGAPATGYSDAPLNPGYAAFVSSHSSRGSVLYVGSNDGMLHAFDATVNCTTTACASGATGGKELFAYVPSYLFNTNVDAQNNPVGLASLTASPLVHHFMVDASPEVADVDFSRANVAEANWLAAGTPAPNWHTILVSGLGKGGMGYFALDVTNPAGVTNETALAGDVLWETDPTTSDYSDMGYSYGKPRVIKTAKYGWTLVLTSGYDNPSGIGHIYLVNPQTGSLYQRIDTTAGSSTNPSGLTYVTAYINNAYDGTADSLYAGDLLGNLWRVDLTCNDTKGNCATSSEFGTMTKFATLTDATGAAQPVTTEPIVAIDPSSTTRYVFVGTGQLLSDKDLVLSQTQTFYALIDGTASAFDTTGAFPLTRSNLADDSTGSATQTTPCLHGITLTESGCSPTQVTGVTPTTGSLQGFYFDLAAATTSGAGTQASAERINIQPIAIDGVAAFAANLYGQNICIKGSSRVFVLNFDSGSASGLGQSVLYGTSSPATVVGYIANSIGVVTDLGVATTTAPGSTVPSGLSLLIGMDTTAGGGGATPGKSLSSIGLSTNQQVSLTRLNWRQVPESQ